MANTMNEAMLPRAALPLTPATVYANFLKFSLMFGINHGCVTAVLNLSVQLLGNQGSYMDSALYIAYAATALVASSAILAALGTRGSLITGTFVYCVYIISLPLALLANSEDTKLLIAIVGGTVGGVAAGFLWAAQGSYFAASAKLYAASSGVSNEQATAKFAAYFGVVFLGTELLLKLLPLVLHLFHIDDSGSDASNATSPSPPHSPPPPSLPLQPHAPPSPASPPAAGHELNTSQIIIAVIYSVCALVAAMGMFSIKDLDKLQREAAAAAAAAASDANGESLTGPTPSTAQTLAPPTGSTNKPVVVEPAKAKFSLRRASAAVLLWWNHPHVLLLAPVQVTFGLSAAVLIYELSGKLVPKAFPSDPIAAGGLLSAMISLIAGLLQVPFKQISAACGKVPVMLIGLASFAGLAIITLSLPGEQLAHPLPLIACYVLQAVGRACYEGVNKALYADFFPHDSDAAFANIVLAVGVASAIGFFFFPQLTRPEAATSALVSSCVAVVAYLLAEMVHRRKAQAAAIGQALT